MVKDKMANLELKKEVRSETNVLSLMKVGLG